MVRDSLGQDVGTFIGAYSLEHAMVYLDTPHGGVPLIVTGPALRAFDFFSKVVWFAEANCSGQAYIPLDSADQGKYGSRLFPWSVISGMSHSLYVAVGNAFVGAEVRSQLWDQTGWWTDDRGCETFKNPEMRVGLLPATYVGDLRTLYPPPYSVGRR